MVDLSVKDVPLMKIYNSLTKKKEDFFPSGREEILIYVCGLTPYDSAHIGHARTYVAFDMIKRYLISKGYDIYHIQNVTDVEDKIIKRCAKTGADPRELTERFQEEAKNLLSRLHVIDADLYPKVTEHLDCIIPMIGTLIEKGFAYETENGIYFDVSKFRDYGKLSGQDMDQMRSGVRKGITEGKRSSLDFALWKKGRSGILDFDSPWGKGRPGWHIECSAIARKYGKRTLDIHGGARDLIFPHHENEIAQSEAATGEQFSRFWMHTGFLTVKHEKMSKSLGNFITLKDALSRHSSNALRLFYIQTHYRSPLDYEEHLVTSSEEGVHRLFNSMGLIKDALASDKEDLGYDSFRKESDAIITSFYESMDDDFDTPQALASLYNLIRQTNAHISGERIDRNQLKKIVEILERMFWIIGLEEERKPLEEKKEEILGILGEFSLEGASSAKEGLERIIDIRETARKEKDYDRSDRIRSMLSEIGIILEDDSGGVRWRMES